MAIVHAEIEMRREAIVKIDAEQWAARWPADRAEFDGTDEEFAVSWLKEVPSDFLRGDYDDEPAVEIEYGAFDGEIDVHVNGIVPA